MIPLLGSFTENASAPAYLYPEKACMGLPTKGS